MKEITLGIKNKSIKTQNLNSILDLFLGICFGNSLQLHIGSNWQVVYIVGVVEKRTTHVRDFNSFKNKVFGGFTWVWLVQTKVGARLVGGQQVFDNQV